MMDKNKFKYYCAKSGLSLSQVAEHIAVNPATLTRKLGGQSDFTRTEIQLIRELLHLTTEEAEAIFFDEKLTQTQERKE